ncbi:hypothetical protein [Pseudomonas triticicola]|uniref:hypothetical protein n=1 Tax=Pseudomonas triticicola TaxID=2842345 RepID=UPI003EBF6A5F
MNKTILALGLLLLSNVSQVQALNQEIRALFQPDPSKPHKNGFINQTPNSGYCQLYPAECTANGMFSIQLPVRFTSNTFIGANETVGVGAPANGRRLTVTNPDTQETETVEVRISGVGSRYVLNRPVTQIAGGSNAVEGHTRLWRTGNWMQGIAPPCMYSGAGEFGADYFRFFWKTVKQGFCGKTVAFPAHISWMYFDTLDIAYELITPNPLTMSTGRYAGSLSYSLGPGADFDMGMYMIPDVTELTLDFVLDVQHTLKVDIPPGGNHVSLEPQGGWQGWLESGRRPTRLYRDQTFNISASSKFSMNIECEHDLGFGDACGIMNSDSAYVGAVNVSVSLPGGLTDSSGRPVRKMPLGRAPTAPFQPATYVERKPGTLHFEVAEQYTDWLIDNAGDTPYKGNITVIWDSETG